MRSQILIESFSFSFFKGPYILFWGGLATLLSKEYFVYWADTTEQLVFLGLVIFASKKYGHKLGAWLDKEADAANSAITKGLADQTKGISSLLLYQPKISQHIY